MKFEWDANKEKANIAKHGVDFSQASKAFDDPARVIAVDTRHSAGELRLFCYGKVNEVVLTVRFTARRGVARIIGAGNWRKGRKIYEQENL